MIWNADFTKNLPDGTAGNQAYMGIFFRDDEGLYRRITQAEGHEVSKNPEKKTVNKIAQTSPEDIVTGHRDEFSKDFVIAKGDKEYEFFNQFMEDRPTGENAKLDILMVNMMKAEKIAGSSHMRYLAYSYQATVTVNTVNYTEGTLNVNFIQASEPVLGTAQLRDEKEEIPEFTPSTEINIESIDLVKEGVVLESGAAVSVGRNKDVWVKVLFAPLGCPYDFEVETSNPAVCTARRNRHSVVITGKSDGTATVTVKSASDELAEAELNVTVRVLAETEREEIPEFTPSGEAEE